MIEFLLLIPLLQVEAGGSGTLDLILQGGAVAVFLLGFGALASGQLRTKYELDAWKRQTERSETQVDTLLPAMREMTQAVKELTVAVRELMQMERERGKA